MTSQESPNKGISFVSLLKEDLKHRKWMLILSSVVQILLGPVAILFAYSNGVSRYSYYGYDYSAADMAQYMLKYAEDMVESVSQSYMPVLQIIIAIVGALIVGLGGYRHLFNRRMTDMVNSVPVKREKQFAVIFTNGFLIWLVPALISVLACFGIVAVQVAQYGLVGILWEGCLRSFLAAGFIFLLIYALVVLSVCLAGTVFNALLNIAFIGFDLIICATLYYLLCESFFDNFMGLPIAFENLLWLSSPISAVMWGAEIATVDADIISEFTTMTWGVFSCIATVLTGIFNLVLALVIYKRRKSEEAEAGVSNKPYRFMVRTFNSIAAGLFVALILAEGHWAYNMTAINGWLIFFAALFCVLAYGIIDSIHARSFKGFFNHKTQMAVTLLVTETILVCFAFDLTKFDDRVISQNSISAAYVHPSTTFGGDTGWGYAAVPGEDGFLTKIPYSVRTAELYGYTQIDPAFAYRIITTPKYYYEYDGSYSHDPLTGEVRGPMDYEERGNTYYMSFIADRKVGYNFMRSYTIGDSDIMNDLIHMDGYMEKNYPLNCGELGYPSTLEIRNQNGTASFQVPEQYIRLVMDAYYRDFKDHYDVEEFGRNDEALVLLCGYEVYYNDDDHSYHDPSANYYHTGMRIYVFPDYDNVMNVLENEFGISALMDDPDDISYIFDYDDYYFDEYGYYDEYENYYSF